MAATRRRRRTGGRAVPFLPTDIAGLQLWLDANDPATLFQDAAKTTAAGDGDVVGAWADKSGQGNDATQATTSKKTSYHTGILNGKPVVRFDGTDDRLTKIPWNGGNVTQPVSIFIAFQLIALAAAEGILVDGDDTTRRNMVFKNTPANNYWAYNAGSSVASTEAADTSTHIISAIFNGASSVLRIDGVQIAAGDPGAQITGGITIGGFVDDSRFSSNVNMGEIIEYEDTTITGDEISQIESYLATRWGVTFP